MDFNSLMGLAGGGSGQGGPFIVLATANANLTIPEGVRFGFISVRTNAAIANITLPLIGGSIVCALVLSCPDGAANNVTITAAATNTIFTGATATIAGDNLIVLFGAPGTTNWEGHVGT